MILNVNYFFSLTLALASPAVSFAGYGYNCGGDYMDAISNCDFPCPSMLGYSADAEVNECPEDKPYCYQTANCPEVTAPEVESTNSTDANLANEDEVLYLKLDTTSVQLIEEPDISAKEDEEQSSTVEYDKRRNMPNPGNHFCAIGWHEAISECETKLDAIPCPPDETGGYMSCPEGTFCYGVSTNCVRAIPATDVPTLTPTTYAPTTDSPSSSPISADDPVNFYFCGSDLADANEYCGTWCRSGDDEDCPKGQTCHLDSTCNATALNFTIDWDVLRLTESPSATPTTSTPTIDDNPESLFCSESAPAINYDGACGTPCPNRNECPQGQYCYQSLTCNRQTDKMKWCGKDMDDMIDRCGTDDAQECKGGTDDECNEGEKCFLSDACLRKEELAESEGMLWCGRSYKHMVEHCPKQCPGGTNEECGLDENGKEMTCFNMKDEDTPCAEEGVGIKEPVAPEMLWCGNNWLHLVENCPKACPEGTDEECGFMGTTCFDMTGSDLVCQTEGFGVKKKGDPSKRFCGNSFAHMHAECPKRCPSGLGDECPGGMTCYEDSLCEVEGQGVAGMEMKDPAGMFCVKKSTQASTCVPCPTGGSECGEGEVCWSDMQWACQGNVATETIVSESTLDVSVEFEDAADEIPDEDEQLVTEPEIEPQSEQEVDVSVEFEEPATDPAPQPEPAKKPAATKPASSETVLVETDAAEELSTPTDQPEPTSEAAPSAATSTEAIQAESPSVQVESPSVQVEPVQAESLQVEPAQTEEPAQAESAASESAEINAAVVTPAIAQSEPLVATVAPISNMPTMKVENLRIALYGLEALTSDHVDAWEQHSGDFVEEFYNTGTTNDAIRDGVSNVASSFEGVEFGVSNGRRNLRVHRNLASAFLITYHQKIQFDSNSGVKLEDVVQHPFSTPTFREEYVSYLKLKEPLLFAELTEVSAVFLPAEMTDPVVVVEATATDDPPISIESNANNVVQSDKLWDSLDESIDIMTVVNQPFITEAYRKKYIEHLQNYLPGTFQLLTDVVADSEPIATNYNLSDTFFCGIEYPVDCSNTKACNKANDCPTGQGCFVAKQCLAVTSDAIAQEPAVSTETESSLPCNLCKPGQIGVDAEIIFNEKITRCAEAYNHMVLNYKEDSPTCLSAQAALSSTCCKDPQSSETLVLEDSESVTETTSTTPTAEVSIVQTVEIDEPDLLYPSNTYFCGTSFEEASNSCSKACPSGKDNECLGLGETCHGNTQCDLRGSFFCGTSWFDASDKCSTPCADGDASACDEGEQCFAWTSCQNTDSFYCGTSFENASQECKLPCPSRSSMDCPDDMGCWAYTTCEATKDGPHESGPEPMNDFFCGDTKEAAASTCSIACQSGDDSECPGDLKCFDATGCSDREQFWCGPNWLGASQSCGKPCSSGSSEECDEGESCYAHTECQSDLFFCGDSFEHASETCGKACPSRSSNECDSGQSCYAFVTACANSDAAQSLAETYTFMASNNVWDPNVDSFTEDDAGEDMPKQEELPDWYVTWEEQMNASSSKAVFTSLALACISVFVALL